MYVPAAPPPRPAKRRGFGGYGFPAIVAPLAIKAASGIFTKSSQSKASGVVGSVVNSANSGNLNAVAVLDTRRFYGISKERAVWSAGYNKVDSAVLAQYNALKRQLPPIPRSATIGPKEAASWATSNVVTADMLAPSNVGSGNAPPKPSVTVMTPAGPVVQPAQPAGVDNVGPPPILYTTPTAPGGGGPMPFVPTAGSGDTGTGETAPVQEAGMLGGISGKGALIAAAVAAGLWVMGSQRKRGG